MDEVMQLLKIIVIKLDKIYSHIEVDWDNLSEKELNDRYESMKSILNDIKENDKSLYIDIKDKKLDNQA